MTSRPDFGARVRTLYSRHRDHIHPYIGTAFEQPDNTRLRIVAVGINAYISPKDWPPKPKWFASWVIEQRYRFYRAIKRDALYLASALLERAPTPSGRNVAWPDSFYVTDAVKTYLPEATGKRANQIDGELFDEHARVWRAELDLMAEHDVLPHLIVVFGEPFWPHACSSFRGEFVDNYKHLRVVDYRHTDGPSLHFVNRLRLAGSSGEQTTLLVRLRHPSARTRKGSVRWLLEQEDSSELARGPEAGGTGAL